jgi:ADP-heptose:LPS heptosyltransferase
VKADRRLSKILAIRFARLGDVILLLPAFASIKSSFPDAKLSFLTGHRCASIAEMCPAVDDVISVDRIAMRDGPPWRALHDVKNLVADIRSRHFDAVIDFHSFRETNLLTWFSRAPVRLGMKRYDAAFLPFCFNEPPISEDKSLHVSEMFQRVAEGLKGVSRAPADRNWVCVPETIQEWRRSVLPDEPTLTLFVDAPVADRRWPPSNFAAVADFAVERLAARVVVLSSSVNAAAADGVLQHSRNPREIRSFTDLSLQQLAAVIAGSRLLVSNDTGPMHLGPALGVRTLGLFSVGLPEHFRPIGKDDQFLRGNPIESIRVEEVTEKVSEMWTTVAGRDPRR